MGIRFSELVWRQQDKLQLDDRNVLIHFYDEVTDAIDRGELGQDEPPEPGWMNDLIELIDGEPLEGEDGESGNYRTSDWDLTQDSDLDEFLEDWIRIRQAGRVDLET